MKFKDRVTYSNARFLVSDIKPETFGSCIILIWEVVEFQY